MANRQQRRHPEPAPRQLHPDMGYMLERLEKPELVGETTALEASEIRARNEHLKAVEVMLKSAQDHVAFLTRARDIAGNERLAFLQGIAKRLGRDPSDQLQINDESGQVHLIARQVAVTPEPVPEPEQAVEGPEEG